jgi:hypothetical protein
MQHGTAGIHDGIGDAMDALDLIAAPDQDRDRIGPGTG